MGNADDNIVKLDTAYARHLASLDAKMQEYVDGYLAEIKVIRDAFNGNLFTAMEYYSKQMQSPDSDIRHIAQQKWVSCVIAMKSEPQPIMPTTQT